MQKIVLFLQALDFAYLFSYARAMGSSDYFLNLEDDVRPAAVAGGPDFVAGVFAFIDEQNRFNPYWSSLLFSKFLSIGRLWRTSDLPKLVDLVLIAYDKQPVDYIMCHFDMLQVTGAFCFGQISAELAEDYEFLANSLRFFTPNLIFLKSPCKKSSTPCELCSLNQCFLKNL